jgi:hypothetical protein
MEAMLPKPDQPTIGPVRRVMSSGVCNEHWVASELEICVNGILKRHT